jgi:hypothetical protein
MRLLWAATMSITMLSTASAQQQGSGTTPSNREAATATSLSDTSLPNTSGATPLAGTMMVAELRETVDSAKVKTGSLVKASVLQDVLVRGRIVIPHGSKLIGHVTETKVRSKDDPESHLGLVFDKVLIKIGKEIKEIAFNGNVLALAPPVPQILDGDPYPHTTSPTTQNQSNTGMMNGPHSMPSANPGSLPSSTSQQISPGNVSGQDREHGSRETVPTDSKYGALGAGSRGVVGLPELSFKPGANSDSATIITSNRHNVKLAGGSQLVVQVNSLVH